MASARTISSRRRFAYDRVQAGRPARGVTVLLIEHDMGVVRDVCDRVVALDHGTLIAEGRFEEVRESPAVLEAYLGRRAGRA